ncbi:MAG TPA: ATP-dependent DNA helicase RecG, partial [Patescibacteria group bacterium]|nr:ATP-dependent DNA helicase RecG [Patescibacteria group bacterium]
AIRDWVAKLPFVLTRKQKVAAWEILQDISQPRPMNRLLEGDVGSGKTVVAALAIYNTVLNKQQAILMAPTEILARQHFQSLTKFFAAEKISIGLLTRSQAEGGGEGLSHGRARKNICQAVKNNELAVLIGTQALLNEDIDFASLGLVIVDEQHRFGVSQRKMIREKSGLTKILPHFLSLTATPIPRSFALTLYGDLDLSIIDEMPKGRKPVLTRLVEPQKRQAAYDFIQKQIRAGHQVFVICPLIAGEDEGMASEKKTVMTEYEKLSQKVFPDLSVGYLHGRMKAEDKAEQMKKFATNQIQILVSTSVVEVGVDIPNATVMMIEGAEKFGLAQLHQFRGRVGRSDQQSYCLLFTESETETARERLHFFASTTSGFKVAEYDLQQRGPGEVYGLAQSGLMNFRLATMRDQELIKLAREMARGLNFSQYPELVQKVKTWEQSVHWE